MGILFFLKKLWTPEQIEGNCLPGEQLKGFMGPVGF